MARKKNNRKGYKPMDLKKIKKASLVMGTANHEMRLKALEITTSKLHKYRKDIFNANLKDFEKAKKANLPYKRENC